MPVDEHLLISQAREAARRTNCVRRAVGAVLVRDGEVIARGANGVPSNYSNCREAGCPRCINGGVTGSGYDTCICIHAEQSAIADAASRGIRTAGSWMYVTLRPCLQCLAISKAAGVQGIRYEEYCSFADEIERAYPALASQFAFLGSALD